MLWTWIFPSYTSAGLQWLRFLQILAIENICFVLTFQIQNANDVLIAPLEKFRKEQIGAAKVSGYGNNALSFPVYLLVCFETWTKNRQTYSNIFDAIVINILANWMELFASEKEII